MRLINKMFIFLGFVFLEVVDRVLLINLVKV